MILIYAVLNAGEIGIFLIKLLRGLFYFSKKEGEQMAKLLLNEQPLVVLPELACKIGLNEAIILQQLNYWLHKG